MQALINPNQNNLVVQVEPDNNIFEVAFPLYWNACPDNIIAYQYTYTNNQYVPYIEPIPIPSADENKATAIQILSNTDWTTIPDVADSALSNPYLVNQAEFISYRSIIRGIAVNPTSGILNWPQLPTEVWSNKIENEPTKIK
jgi:hypothetical protein